MALYFVYLSVYSLFEDIKKITHLWENKLKNILTTNEFNKFLSAFSLFVFNR